MKIAFSTENMPLLNAFIRTHKENDVQIIVGKIESVLFETIENGDAEAYIISSNCTFAKKAISFIKKFNPHIPIVLLVENKPDPNGEEWKTDINNVDIIMSETCGSDIILSRMIYFNINTYIKNFETLHKLTAKMHDKIEFGNCVYDPTRRILYYKDKEIKELSPKEGGILEILAINFGEIVKKEVILEKVWRKSNDYFAGRSMDVYITHLRNTFKNNKIKLTVKNISGIGLILE